MANLRRTVLFGISRFLNSTAAPARVHGCASANGVVQYQSIYRPCVNSFSRYYSSNDGVESMDFDLSNEESKRQLVNRLLYRSKQRGFLELDLVLGSWVEDHIRSLDEKGIKSLIDVLNLENPDLWKWLTGQEQPPEAIDTNPVFIEVRSKVLNNLDSYSSPQTRAPAGQPWVKKAVIALLSVISSWLASYCYTTQFVLLLSRIKAVMVSDPCTVCVVKPIN